MNDLWRGAACLLAGFRALAQPRIRALAAAPIALSLVLYAALLWFGAARASQLIEWLVASIPSWLEWLRWVAWALCVAVAVALFTFTFAITAAALGAPFFGPLAAAVERHLTGRAPPSPPWRQTMVRTPVVLFDELKKIVYALALAVPFLVLFWIPVANVAAPALWLLYCTWTAALAYVDYALANHGLRGRDIRRMLRRRPLLALGFGAAVFAGLAIPLLNILVVPAAVCGGAVLWVHELRAPVKQVSSA